MTVTRPALRYHGGKWVIAPWIIRQMPEHRVFVDLFGGGGSVILRKPRSYSEVYNDLDGQVVNVFRQLRDNGPELKRRLELTPFAREEYSGAIDTHDPIERARRTIVRSFMGFGSDSIKGGSGFRANANRNHTTPAHDWSSYAFRLDQIIDRLRGVVIENRDYRKVIAQQDSPATLFYVDPPYMHETRTGEKRYRFEMTRAEHGELAAALHGIKGKVMLSGYSTEAYSHAFRDWRTETLDATADGGLPRTEILWLNFPDQQLRLGW